MNFIITLDNLKYIELVYGSPIKKQRGIRPKSKVPIYRLLEPITVELSDGELITIPKGFEWDLASAPRHKVAAQNLLKPNNPPVRLN